MARRSPDRSHFGPDRLTRTDTHHTISNDHSLNYLAYPKEDFGGRYHRRDGSRHAWALNLGRRPTFYEHADHSLLEAHLLDFSGDLYGETARVQFTHFLRSERKFDGIDALRMQLKHDIEHARSVLGA